MLTVGQVGMNPAEGWRAVWRLPGSAEHPPLILDAHGATKSQAMAELRQQALTLGALLRDLSGQLRQDVRQELWHMLTGVHDDGGQVQSGNHLSECDQ